MILRRELGFTLVELLVVLAIIGLSLAIAAPFLARHVTGASLNSAAGEIRADHRRGIPSLATRTNLFFCKNLT